MEIIADNVDNESGAKVMKQVGKESDFDRLAKQKTIWPPKTIDLYEYPSKREKR